TLVLHPGRGPAAVQEQCHADPSRPRRRPDRRRGLRGPDAGRQALVPQPGPELEALPGLPERRQVRHPRPDPSGDEGLILALARRGHERGPASLPLPSLPTSKDGPRAPLSAPWRPLRQVVRALLPPAKLRSGTSPHLRVSPTE